MTWRWLEWSVLTLACLLTTLAIWLPFLLGLETFWGIPLNSGGMATVVSNYDGPYYVVVAKSLYQAEVINQFEFDLPVEYYAAHYPLYPLIIRGLSMILPMQDLYIMLMVTTIFSVLSVVTFYEMIRDVAGFKNPLWLALVFLYLPARWLVVRSVGSPEPLFVFLTLVSLWSFYRQKYWTAGIFGGLAQLTKPPGILLFGAFGLAILANHLPKLGITSFGNWLASLPWRAWPIVLIPGALLGLFWWYGTIYGSFWAYFESGDNIHLFWPPFQMFNRAAAWVGSFWLEDIIWLLVICGAGVIALWKRGDVFAWYAMVFFASLMFVSHRDIARYALPMMPLMILAYGDWLEKPGFKILMCLLLVPIYLFAINFIAANTTPISDWRMLL